MKPRIALRPVTKDDLPVLCQQQLDPVANRMAVFPARDWPAFEAHWKAILEDSTVVARAVVADGLLAGQFGVWGPPGERLVGYWIGKEFWGRGIATAGLALLLNEVSERPIGARVAKSNVGSIRVLEKCGFRVSGDDRSTEPPGVDGVDEWLMTLER